MTTLGLNTYAFIWDEPAEATLAWGAAQGFRRADVLLTPGHLWPDEAPPAERAALRRRLAALGMAIESINLPSHDQNLASPRPDARRTTLAFYFDLLEFAHDLGAGAIVVVPGRQAVLNPPAAGRMEGWMRSGLEALLPRARALGVRLLLENLPASPLPRVAELVGFARSFGDTGGALGIAYDAPNALGVGDDVVGSVAVIGPLIGQVHLSDARRHAWAHDPVGEGDVEFPPIGAALAAIGYAGTAMIEVIAADARRGILDSRDRLLAAGPWRRA